MSLSTTYTEVATEEKGVTKNEAGTLPTTFTCLAGSVEVASIPRETMKQQHKLPLIGHELRLVMVPES